MNAGVLGDDLRIGSGNPGAVGLNVGDAGDLVGGAHPRGLSGRVGCRYHGICFRVLFPAQGGGVHPNVVRFVVREEDVITDDGKDGADQAEHCQLDEGEAFFATQPLHGTPICRYRRTIRNYNRKRLELQY